MFTSNLSGYLVAARHAQRSPNLTACATLNRSNKMPELVELSCRQVNHGLTSGCVSRECKQYDSALKSSGLGQLPTACRLQGTCVREYLSNPSLLLLSGLFILIRPK